MKTIIVLLLSSLLFVANVGARSETINKGILTAVIPVSRDIVIDHQRYKLMDNALVVMKTNPKVIIPLSTALEGKKVKFELWEDASNISRVKILIIQE